jgi:undecaprenyl-diphosphatase
MMRIMNKLEAFNESLFLQINAGTGTSKWAIDVAIIIANDLLYLMLLILLANLLWGDFTKRNLTIKACLVAIIGIAINQLIGFIYWHPRPFMIGLGHTWILHAPDSSFPSDHLAVFSGVALTMLFDGEFGIGIVTLLTGLCVGWARVFLGIHFPFDLIGAVVVAGLSLALLTPIWHKVGRLITELVEETYRKILAWPISIGWIKR